METDVDVKQDVKPTGLYSIYDSVAQAFSPPFTADGEPVARRQYGMLVMDMPEHIRGDYMLYKLGEFDYKSGGIKLYLEPLLIIKGDGK